MTALVAYVWRTTLSSQRWVAPLLVAVSVEAILSSRTGDVLPAYASIAVALLFVAMWLAVVVANSEDPQQVPVTVTTANSFARVRIVKHLVALQAAMVLGLLGLVGPAVASPHGVTASQVGSGLGAFLITTLAGVAIGSLLTRPIVRRTAWTVLAGTLAGLADVLIPYGPPARQLLNLFNAPTALGSTLALIALETLVLTTLVIAVSIRLAWARS